MMSRRHAQQFRRLAADDDQADAALPRYPGLADLARLGRADVDTLLARAGQDVQVQAVFWDAYVGAVRIA